MSDPRSNCLSWRVGWTGAASVTAPVIVEAADDVADRVLPYKGRFEQDDGVALRMPQKLGIDDVHFD